MTPYFVENVIIRNGKDSRLKDCGLLYKCFVHVFVSEAVLCITHYLYVETIIFPTE